jgi:hypothetical protein
MQDVPAAARLASSLNLVAAMRGVSMISDGTVQDGDLVAQSDLRLCNLSGQFRIPSST